MKHGPRFLTLHQAKYPPPAARDILPRMNESLAREIEEDLGLEGGLMSLPQRGDRSPGPQKVSYTHDKMIDYIISQPRVTGGQLARVFGYTQAWISQIMSSDAFKERLALRRQEVTDPAVKAALDVWFPSTQESLQHLVDKSLEIITRKLEADKVPDNVALKAFELGARGLGIGGFGNKVPEPAEKPGEDRLEKLADRLTGLLHTKKLEIIDGEVVEVVITPSPTGVPPGA